MAWVAIGIAGATALTKVGTGIAQNSQANSIDRNNKFPTMYVQPEYEKNVAQAQNMAQMGIPQQAYNNQSNAINRNQAVGIATLSRSANPAAGVAATVRASNDAMGNLNAQDAMARNRNLLNLLQERRILAGQKDKAWDWNFQQKYLGNLAKSQALRASGNANISGALSDVGGLATAMAYNGGMSATDGGSYKVGDQWYSRNADGRYVANPMQLNYVSNQWGGNIGG